jgi:hypothetical protein
MLVTLTHVLLPKLAVLEVIEWGRDENVVRQRPAFNELRPLLEPIDWHQDELPDGWLQGTLIVYSSSDIRLADTRSVCSRN